MRRLGILTALAVTLAHCTAGEGSFSLKLAWPGGVRPAGLPTTVYPRIRVVDSTGNEIKAVDLQPGQESADLEGIPNGTGYRVYAEALDAPGTGADVLYYGVSDPLSIQPGRADPTAVILLRLVPSLLADGTSVRIEGSAGSAVTKTSQVTLVLVTDTGVTASISNEPGFPATAATRSAVPLTSVASGTAVPSGFKALSVAWDLAAGTTMDCTLPAGCPQTVYVQFADVNGELSRVASASILVDTLPPGVAFASVQYTPPAGSPLPTVTAATRGTIVSVIVASNEAIDTTRSVSLVAISGTSTLTFTLVGTARADGATFQTTVPMTLPDAGVLSYVPQLTWTDLAGNTSTALPIPTATITVQTKAPGALDTGTPGLITYGRSPWGSKATGGSPKFTVQGVAGAAPGVDSVVVYDASDPSTAAVIGRGPVDSTGAFDITLSQLDRVPVYVSAADAAGNVSPAAFVHNVSWTASFGGKTPGNTTTNPNVMETAADFEITAAGGSLFGPLVSNPAVTVEATSYAAVSAPGDGQSLTTTTAGTVWRAIHASAAAATTSWSAAYDSARGVTLDFGVVNGSNDVTSRTSEWDGTNWQDVTPAAVSPALSSTSLAYDSGRGVTVLFGGCCSNFTNPESQTWEWSGTVWTPVAVTGTTPPPRTGQALVYDAMRGVSVLFGGCTANDGFGNCTTYAADTWQWNGATWTQVALNGTLPSARFNHALAYDSARGVTVLFGGYDGSEALADTWEWNGTTWANVTPAGGSPSARFAHAMAYDLRRGVSVVFGGYGAQGDLSDVWEWNGTTWVNGQPAGAGPSPRAFHALAYDSARGLSLVIGGFNGAGNEAYGVWFNGDGSQGTVLLDTWGWDGTQWSNVYSPELTPSQNGKPAAAYDSTQGATVTLSGSANVDTNPNDTWLFAGLSWDDISPGSVNPPARAGPALVFDAATGTTVMFGGWSGGALLGDTWTWNASTWTQVPLGSTQPSPRFGQAAIYDSVRSVVVLFGGCSAEDAFGSCTLFDSDTWEWNGGQWTNRTPSSGSPPARYGAALAYESGAHPVTLLFGGCEGTDGYGDCTTLANDLWAWDGTAWTQYPQTPPWPAAASLVAMAYDSKRGVTTLLSVPAAVMSGAPGPLPTSTLEWNGTSWTDKTPASSSQSPPLTWQGPGSMAYDSLAQAVDLLNTDGTLWQWKGEVWTNLTPTGGAPYPTPAAGSGFAYDTTRERGIVFGGCCDAAGALFDTTWEWNGAAWSIVTPAPLAPAPRYASAMAYDSARERTVLFSGTGSLTNSDTADTWEWDGSVWTNRTPASGPIARDSHALAYDASANATVLFGGEDANGNPLADVWTWDGTVWTNITPSAGGPTARVSPSMAYDSARSHLVVFGGTSATGQLNDVWEWDGTTWTNAIPTGTSPPVRDSASMVFDLYRGRIVISGGCGQGTISFFCADALTDAWEWDGTQWTNVSPVAAGPSGSGAAAYDTGASTTVLFDAQTTWLNPSAAPRRAAEIAQFSFGAAGETSPVIEGWSVDAYLGGTGNTATTPGRGTPVPGATLAVWDGPLGAWKVLGTNDNDVSAPAELTYSAASADEAGQYVFGGTHTVNVAALTTAGRGFGTVPAQVAVDYIEVTVQYQR